MRTALLFVVIYLGQILAFVSRYFKRGSGTTLPGWLIEKQFPWMLRLLVKDFEQIIFISGTNGKTTTRAALCHLLEKSGQKVCSNRGGANLIRGIASSLILNKTTLGRPLSKVGIFEVEEASLPKLTKYIRPDVLVLTNIFRDQLDAYGEISKTQDYFRQTLVNLAVKKAGKGKSKTLKLPSKNNSTASPLKLILNLDDGMLTNLAKEFWVDVVGFKIISKQEDKPNYEAKETEIFTVKKYLAKNLQYKDLQTNFDLVVESKQKPVKQKILTLLPGLYNVYNLLAAIATATELGFNQKIETDIATFNPVFGRGETFNIQESKVTLFLVKNPAGFNQVLNLIRQNFTDGKVNLSVCVNDNIADGKDVSWLWDLQLEDFLDQFLPSKLITSGTRGLDMLLRFKLAGLEVSEKNYLSDLDQLVEYLETSPGRHIVLCTYTALLELRSGLASKVQLSDMRSQGN